MLLLSWLYPKKKKQGRCPAIDRRKQQRRYRTRRMRGQPRWHEHERRHGDRRKA